MKKKDKKNENSEELGLRLKKIRLTKDLNQREFAKALNISAPAYSELESGKYKPKFELIYNIGKEFNVNLYYLVYGTGEMFIDSSHPFFRSRASFLVKDEEVRRFFSYFEHSPLVQFLILARFRNILQTDKDTIEKELAESLEKK